MDSLTQIVIGIATVEAIAGKELKNKVFLYGTILGTFPDFDVWIGKLFSYENELAFHRSFTHSFLGILLLSPFLGWLLSLWEKKLDFQKWTIIVAACILTHIAIDLFTSWGVQLFFPFTERFSFKTIFVVDPLYTLPWIITLFFLFRTTDVQKRKKMLVNGFLWSSAYLILTVGIKLFMVSKVKEDLEAKHLSYIDFMVKPTFANCILWSINVKDSTGFYLGDVSLLDKTPIRYEFYAKDETITKKIKNDPAVKKLMQVSEGWFIIDENEDHFVFNDLRFGVIDKSGGKQFVFAYALRQNNAGINVQPLPKSLHDGRKTLQKTWSRIKGR